MTLRAFAALFRASRRSSSNVTPRRAFGARVRCERAGKRSTAFASRVVRVAAKSNQIKTTSRRRARASTTRTGAVRDSTVRDPSRGGPRAPRPRFTTRSKPENARARVVRSPPNRPSPRTRARDRIRSARASYLSPRAASRASRAPHFASRRARGSRTMNALAQVRVGSRVVGARDATRRRARATRGTARARSAFETIGRSRARR